MAPGLPVHVVQRGNNRQACFYKDQDRSFYLFHLQRLLGRAGCALHAYCLMTNHVHLLITPREADSCATLMKHLGQLHTQYVNHNYGRSGTLWEGRFHSCLVQSDRYLLTCYRYIDLNPVRAGLTVHPGDYAWSSYRANSGGRFGVLLTPHEEYLRLGCRERPAHLEYSQLLELGLEPGQADAIRKATYGNVALGDESFKRALAAKLGKRVEHGRAGRPPEKRGLSLI